MSAVVEKPQQVSMDEIRTFDNDAQALVALYNEAGWTTKRTKRGHVMAFSPDGQASSSISRDSLRGRSGRNAAAPLKKWLRDQAEAIGQAKGAAFGIADLDEATQPVEARFSAEVPVRVKKALATDSVFTGYVAALEADGIDPYANRLAISLDGGVSRWYVADVKKSLIVTHSPDMTADDAFAHAVETEIITAPEADVKKYKCPDCDQTFANAGAVNLHQKRDHTGGWECEECGAKFKGGRSLGKHREDAHGVLQPATIKKAKAEGRWCEECGKTFVTASGLGGHRGKVHRTAGGLSLSELALHKVAEAGGQWTAAQADADPDLNRTDGVRGKRGGLMLARLAQQGRLVRVDKGVYQLPGEVTVSHTEPRDVLVTTPAVTPSRDTEDTGDVPVSSPVTDVLVDLPDGDDAVAMVAKIRAVVTPPLLAQLREVTAERDQLRHDLDIMTKERDDMKARVQLLNEAFRALGDD